MKLLTRYATACGLTEKEIGQQQFVEQFFPLPFAKYITLHAASGQGAKNYSFWGLVVELIKPYLEARNIEIVQLGVKDDPAINGCHHTMGRTNEHQASYLISNAMLHMGNDSVWCHRAGHQGVNLVEVFGSTSESNHAPYTYDATKTRFFTSHRSGRKATFSSQESPKTVDYIDPFDVARAVLELLKIENQITGKTLTIGPSFNTTVMEHIPNMSLNPTFNPMVATAIRMDLHHNEEILAQVLQSGRKVNVITKAPINLNLLQAFAPNILSYSHEIMPDCPIPYLKTLAKILPNRMFFTRLQDDKAVADLRFHFFEHVAIQKITDTTKDDVQKRMAEYLNEPNFVIDTALSSGKMRFRTNKVILSKGKIYLSLVHEKLDQPIEGSNTVGNIMDDADFWKDANHFMLFNQ